MTYHSFHPILSCRSAEVDMLLQCCARHCSLASVPSSPLHPAQRFMEQRCITWDKRGQVHENALLSSQKGAPMSAEFGLLLRSSVLAQALTCLCTQDWVLL